MSHLPIRSVLDDRGVLLEGRYPEQSVVMGRLLASRYPEQSVVMGRLLASRYPEPLVIRIEVFWHGYLGNSVSIHGPLTAAIVTWPRNDSGSTKLIFAVVLGPVKWVGNQARPCQGRCAIRASDGNGGNNYNVTFVTNSTGAITAAALSVMASSQSKTYGTVLTLGTTAFTTAGLFSGDSVTAVTLTSPGTAASAAVSGSPYTITASAAIGTGLANYAITYPTGSLTVSPAPVVFALQSNRNWLLSGQDLIVVAVASSTTADGAVTFYDNGGTLVAQPLTFAAGQNQAVLDTTTLAPGRHLISVGYASASGNYAMTSASPVVTETIFPANATILTVANTSSNPNVAGSLPWAVAQADASNAAAVITFASGQGQAFATPQTITLAAPLNLTDTSPVGIEGPSWGVTLVGDYSQSRFPILSVAQAANLAVQGVIIGTQSPGANGDLHVAGVLDVLDTVGNLGSVLSVTGGGTIGLGGQTATADSLTLTSGSVTDGTLSTGTRTVFSGDVSANLNGSGGLVKQGTGSVVLSGNNHYDGGTAVLGGTLVVAGAHALPNGTSLTIGAGAQLIFNSSLSAAPATASVEMTTMSIAPSVGTSLDTRGTTTAPIVSNAISSIPVVSIMTATDVVKDSGSTRNSQSPIVPSAALQPPQSVPAGALSLSDANRLVGALTAERIAGNLA